MDLRIGRPLALALGSATAITALLLAAYFVAPVAAWDATALHGLMTLSESRWIWHLGDGTVHSADPVFVVAALVVVCGLAVRWGRPRQALAALLLVGGASAATLLIKVVAAHPRYSPLLAPHQLSAEAFPSGHATGAMSLALAAVLVANQRWRLTAAILGGLYALAVGIAAMVQGWHFPSDVLAGYLVAATAAMLVLAALRATDRAAIGRRSGNRRPWFSRRSAAIRAVEVLGAAVAAAFALAAILYPGELASYVSTHTTAAFAAGCIAAATIGLVYGMTAELDAG